MAVGDEAIVIISPYSSVKVGVVAVIERVKRDHFGVGEHLYILMGLRNSLFREHEIRQYHGK